MPIGARGIAAALCLPGSSAVSYSRMRAAPDVIESLGECGIAKVTMPGIESVAMFTAAAFVPGLLRGEIPGCCLAMNVTGEGAALSACLILTDSAASNDLTVT